MNYPLEKYHFYQNGNKIIAVSTYAGKTVRGVATCHPDDHFDIEMGKKIAAARCNQKVAMKRYANAQKRANQAREALAKAENKVKDMYEYLNDSYLAANEAAQHIDALMNEVRENH